MNNSDVIDDVAEYLRAGNKITGEEAAKLFGVFGSFHRIIKDLRDGCISRQPMNIKGCPRPNLTRSGKHNVYFLVK